MFIYYAIREKSTSKYLPQVKCSFSYTEPVDDGGARGPRLFISKRSAINALTAWLAGKWDLDHNDGGHNIIKQQHRMKWNMEIVAFEVKEITVCKNI